VSAGAVDLAMALGLDKRIVLRCLQPGAGFGGLFVESDIEALAQLASGKGIALKTLRAAREVNRSLCDPVMEKISQAIEECDSSGLWLCLDWLSSRTQLRGRFRPDSARSISAEAGSTSSCL